MWAWLIAKLSEIAIAPMFAGINIVQILQGIKGFLNAVFNNIKAHWRIYLPIFLACLWIGSSYGWYRDHNLLVKERAAHKLDVENFKRAQAEADSKAKSIKESLQQEAASNANAADARYGELLAQYRANLVRFKADQGRAEQPNHSQLPPAQSGDGASSSPVVPSNSIIISLEDAQICAVNTARLLAVHDWALNPPKDGM